MSKQQNLTKISFLILTAILLTTFCYTCFLPMASAAIIMPMPANCLDQHFTADHSCPPGDNCCLSHKNYLDEVSQNILTDNINFLEPAIINSCLLAPVLKPEQSPYKIAAAFHPPRSDANLDSIFKKE